MSQLRQCVHWNLVLGYVRLQDPQVFEIVSTAGAGGIAAVRTNLVCHSTSISGNSAGRTTLLEPWSYSVENEGAKMLPRLCINRI